MGPQLKGCGRFDIDLLAPPRRHASMGPQLKGCGRCRSCSLTIRQFLLQWGRSLRAAEGGVRTIQGLLDGAASMGPQLKGCGRRTLQRSIKRLNSRFNGAAA